MKSENSLEFKEGIRYIEDILKEVAKEQGLSEKEVREIWEIHKKYIKQCMNDPDVTVINIPYVGLLYFNAITSKRVVARTRNKDLKKVLGDKEKSVRLAVTKDLEKSKEEKKTKVLYPQTRLGGLYKFYRRILENLGMSKKSSYSTVNNISKVIEEYSNNE